MRRFLAVLLIALALATLAVYARAVMAPLTLSIGSGAPTLVQNGAIASTNSQSIAFTLPLPSTAGTALVALMGYNLAGASPTLPAGFVLLASITDGQRAMTAWIYPNNPGGITNVNFTTATFPVGPSLTHLSEWANVAFASALDASGTASNTVGTTLTPVTTTSVTGSSEVAIAVWRQTIAAPAVVVFTTPAAWTRLADNGATSASAHLDAEYQLNPATGAPLSALLTSDTATNTYAGAVIIVLKAAHPVVDQTAYIAY